MAERKSFAERAADGGGPVSKRELERLRVRRGDPAPVLEYAFGEPTKPKLRKLDLLREARARQIESRLRHAAGRAETDFALAGVAGRAAREFERSR
jgi:hypothetical protein